MALLLLIPFYTIIRTLLGLRAGCNINDAKYILGNPIKIENGVYGIIYTFSGGIQLTVVNSEGKVGAITIDRYGIDTVRGIKVGDNVNKVIASYGVVTPSNY